MVALKVFGKYIASLAVLTFQTNAISLKMGPWNHLFLKYLISGKSAKDKVVLFLLNVESTGGGRHMRNLLKNALKTQQELKNL